MKIAICIVAYNRLTSVKRLFRSLEQARYCQQVDLIVSIDKSDNTEVADYAKTLKWAFGEFIICEHAENLGLRKHILMCGKFLEKYDALIVLEDDIVVSPNFFIYATQCVEKYKEDDRIAGISLYNFNVNYQNKLPFVPLKDSNDVYFMNCAQSWGQVWMRKQWFAFFCWYKDCSEEFADDEELPVCLSKWPKSSWLKYHTKYCIKENKYFVYPYLSLSTNNSDVGTHVNQKSTLFQSVLSFCPQELYRLPSLDDSEIKYDGFFEAKFLAKYLGLDESDLCVDLNGEKRKQKKYVLSRKVQKYNLVKSFGLSYRPIELNIVIENPGDEIFLYDTELFAVNVIKERSLNFFKYTYGSALSYLLKNIGQLTLLQLLVAKCVRKIIGRKCF